MTYDQSDLAALERQLWQAGDARMADLAAAALNLRPMKDRAEALLGGLQAIQERMAKVNLRTAKKSELANLLIEIAAEVYDALVCAYEAEGCTRSDAQGIVDAEMLP